MAEDVHAVALRQRAHRAFTTEAVDEAVVRRVLETATRAPSAENTQPWRFVVVRDDVLRAAIGELTEKAWDRGAKEWAKGTLTPDLYADVAAGATGGVSAAPVLIVVCADTIDCAPAVLPASIWPCVQNLLLAATAERLGSALTTLAMAYGTQLQELLGLPAEIIPMAVVPLGHPARELKPGRRRPLDEVTTWR